MADEDDDKINLDDIEDDEIEIEEEVELEAQEGSPDPDDEPKKPIPEKNKEFIRLRKRAQDAEDRARRAEEVSARNSGQIDILTRTAFQGQSQADKQAEADRLSAMTPEERIEYRISQERGQIQAAFQQQGFQTADTLDALRFERLCDKNEVYAKIAEETEARVMKLRAQGQNVERKIMATQILGEKAAARAGRPKVKETPRKQGSGSGSDVAPDRAEQKAGKKGKTAKDRLANITF